VRFRIIDRSRDRAHESRALAIQPRTLEVLAPFGVSERLVKLGNPNVRVVLHTGARRVRVRLFDVGLQDTAYPFLLFLSQAVTEEVLAEHLDGKGVRVERGTALSALEQDGNGVTCTLRGSDRLHGTETIRARYVVGADGAHSTVRDLAGIPFPGKDYPQTFVLADLEAEGLVAGSAHVFLSPAGILFFFPLIAPATWRVIVMQPPGAASLVPVTLDRVQQLAVAYGVTGVRLRDPVWMTAFRLHARRAATLAAGRVFLAGDAAHIHSPAGGQGMNTGIQDAVNLGWKLALVTGGSAPASLLDTFDVERAPVARRVLAMTDLAFRVATSTHGPVTTLRAHVAPRLLPAAAALTPARARIFRIIGELSIRYPRSPLTAGPRAWPRRRRPRPGDRLPDTPLAGTTLHRALRAPGFHLLLGGPLECWDERDVRALVERRWLHVHHLTRGLDASQSVPHPLVDRSGRAGRVLGLRQDRPEAILVRPDGYLAYRGGADLGPVRAYLDTWLPPERGHSS
jgi:2-polyprenyl-6-methoxyphenol hydroxylase-like FAD-dependent oxidoreductase